MPKVFQTFHERLIENRKRELVLDAKDKPIPHSKWRAIIVDYMGRRKTVTLASSWLESQQQADFLQGQQDAIRKGLAPAPTPSNKAMRRPFMDVVAEYLEWGKSCGGRGGRPWGEYHAPLRLNDLKWWSEQLNLKILGDLEGCLPKAERALRKVKETGRRGKPLSGKTLKNMTEALNAFCNWAAHKSRGYLNANPLDGVTQYNSDPEVIRRAVMQEEMRAILGAGEEWQRLLLETALFTGLRRNELRSLLPDDVDAEGTIRIDASIDKARKERLHPIPKALAARLLAYAAKDEARHLYSKHYRRKDAKRPIPEHPLLFVPWNTARLVVQLAEKAGVPKLTKAGKIDFHALRTGYINLLLADGHDVKTVQTLARHASVSMTLKVYGRPNDERINAAVEGLERTLETLDDNTTCAEPDNPHSQPKEQPLDNQRVALGNTWRRDRESLHALFTTSLFYGQLGITG